MTSPSFSSRRAFTLIELLVVISILAILMTMLIPSVNSALEQAKRTQAKNDAVQIATAVTAYLTEYGKMPPPATGGDIADANTEGLWTALMPNAGAAGGGADNPRGIIFLEIPNAKKGKNGRANGGGKYLDSWGQPYIIALDGDYDNSVAPTGLPAVRKTVAVYSKGNPANTTDFAKTDKWIKSWE